MEKVPEREVVPPQYQGMTKEAVEIAWIIPHYLDSEKTAAEYERKRIALEYLAQQEGQAAEHKAVSTEIPETDISTAETSESSIEEFLRQPNVQATAKAIEAALVSGSDVSDTSLHNLIYTLLTKRAWLHEEQMRRGTNDLTWMQETFKPQNEWYRNTIAALNANFESAGIETADNPAWFSVTASDAQQESEQAPHYKVYATLSIHDYGKIAELPALIKKLQKLGTETGEKIKIKIPRSFIGFSTHNDSIVVHCSSKETSHRALEAIDSWKTEEGLQPVERELDRVVISLDGKSEINGKHESFSQLIANHITKWVQEHKDNYPADIIASEAVKHAINLSQKAPAIK